ncbi:MAG: response regulator [Deltaproteobacteria bacterium]|nr:MAG: response regulator [Deltaproteobacteria bacterium]
MEKENILVVEDEDIMREALVDWFSGEGHKVDAAMDGDKELDKFKLEDYDAMVIDLKLPGRDGLSVLKEVKAKNPKAKVVIITAYPSIETAVDAMRRGAIDYLPKPFELERLETSLTQSYEAPYEVDVTTVPPVETPTVVKEEAVTPCIWMQAGIVRKRECNIGYQCNNGCNFHAAMMKNPKYGNDLRIKPFIEKVDSLVGQNQCRYTMSGEVLFRICSNVYRCEKCEFAQGFQDKIDHQIAKKAAHRKTVLDG